MQEVERVPILPSGPIRGAQISGFVPCNYTCQPRLHNKTPPAQRPKTIRSYRLLWVYWSAEPFFQSWMGSFIFPRVWIGTSAEPRQALSHVWGVSGMKPGWSQLSNWTLPHGVQEPSSDGLTQACSPGACRAPPTEQRYLRPLQASELVHLHFHFILWAKASHQIRFEEQRNRPLVVMGEDAKSHCKGRVENSILICTQLTTLFIVGTREESLGAWGWGQGLEGKQWSGNHGSPSEMLVENSHNTILIERSS